MLGNLFRITDFPVIGFSSPDQLTYGCTRIIQSGVRSHLMVAVRMASSDAPDLESSAGLLTCAQLPPLSFSSEMVGALLEKDSMFKVTPNPPHSDPASPYESLDSKKLHEAAERALDHYLGPPTVDIMAAPYKPNTLYMANPDADTESLLADACETLGSATVMLNNHAALVEGTHRKTLQGIAQIVMLAELAVNRVLDKLVPTE
jgi:hypothetical protein